MEHMSNIFSTSFGINFAKLTHVWLPLISLTAKINSLLFFSHPVDDAFIVIFLGVLVTEYRFGLCQRLSQKSKRNSDLSPDLTAQLKLLA